MKLKILFSLIATAALTQIPVWAQTSGVGRNSGVAQTPGAAQPALVVAQAPGEPELRALLKAPIVKATGAYLAPDSVTKLQALLKANPDLVNQPIIQLRGEDASTPLLEAVIIGNVDAVRTLLELKAKPNLALSREMPPLQEALVNRLPGDVRLNMIRLLLASGADPTGSFHAWAGLTNWTDRKTYFAAADALAQAKGNFSITNATGATPLQIAVVCDNVLAVEKLVALGAKADAVVNDLAWAGRGTAEGDKIVKLLNLKAPGQP